MNEHGFIKSVERQLPSWIERWKIADPYHGGIFDTCYFGYYGSVLFAEYKYEPALPVRNSTHLARAKLSALQRQWMAGKVNRGITCLAVFGHGPGGVVTQDVKKTEGIGKEQFLQMYITKEEIAATIADLLEAP